MTAQIAPLSDASLIDADAAAQHYDLIYAPLAASYPQDAALVLFQHRYAGGITVRRVNVRNRAAFISTLVEIGNAGRIDNPIAPRDPKSIERRADEESRRIGKAVNPMWKRGGVEDCYPLPALFLDIDVVHANHVEKNLPTREQAMDLLARAPLAPTLVTEGPGGFHVWFAFKTLLAPEQEQDALARLATWLHSAGAFNGYEVDLSPIRREGGLRFAGTLSAKSLAAAPLTQQIVTADASKRYGYDDLVAALPEATRDFAESQKPKPRLSRAGRTSIADRDGEIIPNVDESGDEVKPWTRLASAWPISKMLTEIFGVELRGDRVVWPREDGTVHPTDSHGQLISPDWDFDTEALSIHGQRWKTDWSVIKKFGAITSWTVLRDVICQGDVKQAGRLAAFVMSDDDLAFDRIDDLTTLINDEPGEEIEDRLVQLFTMSEPHVAPQRADKPSRALAVVDDLPVDIVDGEIYEPDEVPADPEEVGSIPARVVHEHQITHDIVIDAASRRVFRIVKETDKTTNAVTTTKRPITDWYAYREARHVDGDEVTYDVVLVKANGREYRKRMTEAHSLNIVKVREVMAAGVALPEDYKDRVALENMLEMLHHDDLVERPVIRHTGWWTNPSGEHCFLGVRSSISRGGVRNDYLATMPKGVDGEGAKTDRPVQENTGWHDFPIDLDEAMGAFEGFIRIAPKRRRLGIAALGLLFAAPLGAKQRTTLVLVAKRDSAKSAYAARLTAFFSLAEISGGDPMINVDADTLPTIRNWVRWNAYLPVWEDDLRVSTESRRKTEAAFEKGNTLIQGNFNGALGGQAQGDGGVRAVMPMRAPGILTAERMSTESAIVTRSVMEYLQPGDVEITDQGGRRNGLDEFTEEFAETGLANAAYGDFLAFLSGQLDDRGDLAPASPQAAVDALASWAAKTTKRFMLAQPHTSRNGMCVAYLRTGWEAAYAWAESRGRLHLLPSRDEVDAALAELLVATEQATKESDPGLRFLKAFWEYVTSGRGHVAGPGGTVPYRHDNDLHFALTVGWRQTVLGGEPVYQPLGTRAGYVSPDGEHIVMGMAGLKDAVKAYDPDLAGIEEATMRDLLRPHVLPEYVDRAGKVSTRLRFPKANRPRGVVVALAKLMGEESDEVTPAPAGASTALETKDIPSEPLALSTDNGERPAQCVCETPNDACDCDDF